MSSEFLVALASITIDADNNTLQLDEAGVVAAATIASGTYYLRDDDFGAAIGLALDGAFGSANSYQCRLINSGGLASANISPSNRSAVVRVSLAAGAVAFRVRWNHASATFSPGTLGFAVEKSAADVNYEESTLSPSAMWVPSDRHVDIIPDLSVVRAEVEMADGGIDAIQRSAAQHRRRVRFELIDGRRVFAQRNTSDPNSSWSRFWALVADGRPVELHELDLQSGQTSLLGTLSSSTLVLADGITKWKIAGDSAESIGAVRVLSGMDHWDFELEWVGVPA